MRFETDKIEPHGYFQTYLRLASEIGPQGHVLELGVQGGGSLGMWQAFFPAGEVAGVDINADSHWPEGTVRIVASQDDPDLPAKAGGPFDLIIDDASHDGGLTRKSFDLMWPSVKPGGYYVIEDWSVALRDDQHWGKCWGDSMLRTAESLLSLLDYRDAPVESIEYRYGMIILHKRSGE